MKKGLFLLIVIMSSLSMTFLGCGLNEPQTEKEFQGFDQSEGTVVNNDQETEQIIENLIIIKYRDTPVNIADSRFEHLNTVKSSFIRGAWYDNQNQYMVIKLIETYYHYCGLPKTVWDEFKKADSFGSYYNQVIKGEFDCREGYVPTY